MGQGDAGRGLGVADRTQGRATKGFAGLSIVFFLFCIPIERIVSREPSLVCYPSPRTSAQRGWIADAGIVLPTQHGYFSARATPTTRKLLMGGTTAKHGLMRIFWPLDLRGGDSESPPGVLVGWRNSAMDIFVVAVVRDINVCIFFSANKTSFSFPLPVLLPRVVLDGLMSGAVFFFFG